jgi:hypothetical protein
MEALDKRLNECQRLQNTTLDLSGLKIEPTDAIKVAAVLPKWCVKAMFSPGGDAVHAMVVHAMWFRVLALLCNYYWTIGDIISSDDNSSVRVLTLFGRQHRSKITVSSCSSDVCFLCFMGLSLSLSPFAIIQFGAFEVHFQW